MLAKPVTGKAAAIVAATVLSGGAAAAATGSLPDPVQRTVAGGLGHVGLETSSPDSLPALTDDVIVEPGAEEGDGEEAGGDGQTAVGPDATGPARYGLCTAAEASAGAPGRDGKPPAFANLAQTAEDAGQTVEEFCADAEPGRSADGIDDASRPEGAGKPEDAGKPTEVGPLDRGR